MSRFMIESKAKKSHSKLIRTIFVAMIFTLSIPRSSGETNHLRNSLNNCILQIRELIIKNSSISLYDKMNEARKRRREIRRRRRRRTTNDFIKSRVHDCVICSFSLSHSLLATDFEIIIFSPHSRTITGERTRKM